MTDEEFFKSVLGLPPLLPPNDEQIKLRIQGYFKKQYNAEKEELGKFETALNYSLSEINEVKLLVINERLAELEGANKFSWLSLLLSVAVLPFASVAIAAVASVALHKILQNRLIFAKFTAKLKITGELSPKQQKLLSDMGDFKYSFDKRKGKLKQAHSVVANSDSIEAKIFTELPGIVKDMFSSAAGVNYDTEPEPTRDAKAKVRVSLVALGLELKFKAELKSLEVRNTQFMENLNDQLYADNSSPIVFDFAKSIYEHISENPIKSLKVQTIPEIDHIRLISQNIFTPLLVLSNIAVPVEIEPERSITQSIRDPGFKPTYTFLSDTIIPERVKANETQKKVLDELGQILLVPNELRRGRVFSYAQKYSKDQRVRHLEIVKRFKVLLKQS